MSNIQAYIDGMKLKKVAVGGFDKESVYTSMQELSALYQKDIVNLKENNEKLETELNKTAEELETANKEIQQLEFQLEDEQKHRNEYDERITALTQATETVRDTKEKLIEDAKRDAQEILAIADARAAETLDMAKQKAAEIVARANEKAESARHECYMQKQQKELVIAKIADAKQQYNSSMLKLRSGLSEILSELDDLQVEGVEQTASKYETQAKPEEDVVRTIIYERPNRLVRKVAGCVSEYDRR